MRARARGASAVVALTLTAALAGAAGCVDGTALSHEVRSEVVLKIAILYSGEIEADGRPVEMRELIGLLDRLTAAHGAVWYFYAEGRSESAISALHVTNELARRRLPVARSQRRDFADFHPARVTLASRGE